MCSRSRAAEADVWSTDRDFAGTGVASWSTRNLMRGLAEAARDSGKGQATSQVAVAHADEPLLVEEVPDRVSLRPRR
jgi:hypothetical protein